MTSQERRPAATPDRSSGVIVHEWIERIGGAERVLDAFVDMFPGTDVFCLWNEAPDRYPSATVHESVLASTPLRGRKALSVPVLPLVWRGAASVLGEREWALVSSHLFAHHVRVPGVAPERQFSYVYTPARYLWTPELDGRGAALPVRCVAPALRHVDRRRARTLRNVAVVSEFVQERVRRTWGVESTVVHPPVEVSRLQGADWADRLTAAERELLESLPEGFLLGASRFVPYKRLDAVLDAGRATGRHVVLAGAGPDEGALRAAAVEKGASATFVIGPSDALLAALMQRAAVYVFPPVEDFGIMPVEAMALGTPVVVNATGGAAESAGEVGVVVPDLAPETLREGVERAVGVPREACRARAGAFSSERFAREITEWTSR